MVVWYGSMVVVYYSIPYDRIRQMQMMIDGIRQTAAVLNVSTVLNVCW